MDRLPGLLTSEEMTLADVLYNDGELHPERFPTDGLFCLFLPKFQWRTVIFHHEKRHISENIAPPIISFRDYTNDYILYTIGDTK